MKIAVQHAGLVCRSEETADKFYGDLLGLEKKGPAILPKNLSASIFGVDTDLTMIHYMKDGLHFEIFVHESLEKRPNPIEHQCISVENRDVFIERCRSMGVALNLIPKGEKLLVFITDFDGNLFEIK